MLETFSRHLVLGMLQIRIQGQGEPSALYRTTESIYGRYPQFKELIHVREGKKHPNNSKRT